MRVEPSTAVGCGHTVDKSGGALAMVVLVVLNVWGTSVEEIVVARAARLAAVV